MAGWPGDWITERGFFLFLQTSRFWIDCGINHDGMGFWFGVYLCFRGQVR